MDISKLISKFPGKLHLPQSEAYTQSNDSYFTAFEKEVYPALIFKPTTAHDLSRFVQAVQDPTLTDPLPIAIRGGGHTPWAGAANIHNGITIDLSDLKGVTVENGIASIASGERWSNVYSTLEQHGLAVVGGRASKVGVAGLTLSGVLSFFSSQLGFVCDNVVNYEVVLSSGAIIQANADTNSDLFIALKGGLNNFGVVTRFDFATFDQGPLWGGAIFYTSDAVSEIFRATVDFACAEPADERAHLITGTSWSAAGENGLVNIYHTGNVSDSPATKPFIDTEHQVYNTIRSDSLSNLTKEQGDFSRDGARQWYFTTSVKVDLQLLHDIKDLWLKVVEVFKSDQGFVLSLVFQPITVGMLRKSQQKGKNSLGLSPSDGPLIIVLLASVHSSATEDDNVCEAVLSLITQIDKLSQDRGLGARYRFTNYGHQKQGIVQGYGPDSMAHLRAVSAKFDPQQFFQKRVTSGFKLP